MKIIERKKLYESAERAGANTGYQSDYRNQTLWKIGVNESV